MNYLGLFQLPKGTCRKPHKFGTKDNYLVFAAGAMVTQTVLATSQLGVTAARTGQGGNGEIWQEAVNNSNYKAWSMLWEGGIRKTVGKKFFGAIQFVPPAEDSWGSSWQRLVCDAVSVPETMRKRFWLDKGKKVARSTINRRRQNTTSQVKKTFQGEW